MAQQAGLDSHISIPQVDVERLRNKAMKLYLQRELRRLERRIVHLKQELPPTVSQAAWGLWWAKVGSTKEDWDQLLELKYLEAVRKAILDTLAML